MGLFENKQFAAGTNAIAQAVADATQKNGAKSIIGGGDSVKALNKAKLGDKVTFMSTGGGASRNFWKARSCPVSRRRATRAAAAAVRTERMFEDENEDEDDFNMNKERKLIIAGNWK